MAAISEKNEMSEPLEGQTFDSYEDFQSYWKKEVSIHRASPVPIYAIWLYTGLDRTYYSFVFL